MAFLDIPDKILFAFVTSLYAVHVLATHLLMFAHHNAWYNVKYNF